MRTEIIFFREAQNKFGTLGQEKGLVGRESQVNWAFLDQDWFGKDLLSEKGIPSRLGYCFLVNEEFLCFKALFSGKVQGHPEREEEEFSEELWRYDVAEFFLKGQSEQEYLEFNLAPNGAWWSCLFSSVRKVVLPNHPLEGVVTRSVTHKQSREVSALIPWRSLPREMRGKKIVSNVTFVFGSSYGLENQQFVTCALLQGEEPDFHQPNGFVPVRLCEKEEGSH